MTDVAVIGYGPAGAAAAIAAHDAGATVVIHEKTGAGGGNALYAGGFLWDAPNAADHIDALSFGRTPRDVVEAYAAGLGELDGWLSSLGATIEPFDPPPGGRLPAAFPSWPSFPAGDGIRYKVVGGGEGRRGEALWRVLDAAVRERGIRIEFNSAITELPRDTPVVLACGGFEGDPGLADAYLPLGPTWPVGHAANTGDGLRMAQAAGAALWHMYGFFGWFAFRTPEFPSPFAIDFFDPGFILVDADGRRFADETAYEVHDRLRALLTYLPDNPNRPHLPTYAIFDEQCRRAGPLNGLLGTPNDYVWSAGQLGRDRARLDPPRRRPRPARARRHAARLLRPHVLPAARGRAVRDRDLAGRGRDDRRAAPRRACSRAASRRQSDRRPLRRRRRLDGLGTPDRPRRRADRRARLRPDRRR